MMTDILTVVWKEWREFRDQIFRLKRGGLSALIALLMLGVFTPLQMGTMWLTSPLMLAYWPLLASGMVSTLIADAFAGERERHTLEALLATRLSDSAILIGKVVAAVLYGLLFTVVNILVGIVVLMSRHWGEDFVAPPLSQLVLIVVLVTLACATLAGVGVFISLRAATVRQAQQTLGVLMMVMFIGPFLFLQMLGTESRLRLAARLTQVGVDSITTWAIIGLGAAALVLNLLALARFRRGKLVLD
jgi:ABC-2 type transport system permease protein